MHSMQHLWSSFRVQPNFELGGLRDDTEDCEHDRNPSGGPSKSCWIVDNNILVRLAGNKSSFCYRFINLEKFLQMTPARVHSQQSGSSALLFSPAESSIKENDSSICPLHRSNELLGEGEKNLASALQPFSRNSKRFWPKVIWKQVALSGVLASSFFSMKRVWRIHFAINHAQPGFKCLDHLLMDNRIHIAVFSGFVVHVWWAEYHTRSERRGALARPSRVGKELSRTVQSQYLQVPRQRENWRERRTRVQLRPRSRVCKSLLVWDLQQDVSSKSTCQNRLSRDPQDVIEAICQPLLEWRVPNLIANFGRSSCCLADSGSDALITQGNCQNWWKMI